MSLYPTVSSLQGHGSGSELGSAIGMDQYSNEFFDPDLFGTDLDPDVKMHFTFFSPFH